MNMKMQRRDWLKLGVAGGLAWSGVQEALAQGLAAPAFASAAPELAPLQGLRGQDLDARDLQIEGRLPDGLRGTYYRNGPGLMARGEERYRHWFDGDGLVQAWTFGGSAGQAQVAHKARFVQTRKFKAEAEAGRFLLPAFGTAIPPRMAIQNADSLNVANTSVLLLNGRLHALWEGGSAYELDPQTLATRGPRVWSPELAGMPFSAHPKVEPDGTVWNFGTAGDRMAVYQISAQGQVLRNEVFDSPVPVPMVHDFAVSQRFLVFLLPPIQLDMAALRGGQSMLDSMRWQAQDATRVLVVDKADFSRRRVFEMPASLVFHFGNAWDEGPAGAETLHLDYVESRPLPQVNAELRQVMRGERPVPQSSQPRFMRLQMGAAAAGAAGLSPASAGRITLQSRSESVEFPVVDPRVVGQRHRHVYYPTAVDLGTRWGFNGLMHLDLDSGRRERFAFGPEVVLEEHVLVPKPGTPQGAAGEGQGWLLGLGYDCRRQRSFASVFDAQALSAGPLARVWLPYWVTYGFHGKFYGEVVRA